MVTEEARTEIVEALSLLPLRELGGIMKAVASSMDEDNRVALAEVILTGSRIYPKVERWMEARFTNYYKATPLRIARECMSRMRINSRMLPWLIKTAQRVKHRVRLRRSRERQRNRGER